MPTDRLAPGLKAEIVTTVDDKLVVKHMGGEGVLSTPSMIGLMARAGIEAVQAHLPEGHTTHDLLISLVRNFLDSVDDTK
jgi:fluoroacetyl-CoA thioesterase